ncbi:MAG: hypothetical protein K5640_02455 [Treponema sp.]|nr:hypothetical protein [Treponema sp.]
MTKINKVIIAMIDDVTKSLTIARVCESIPKAEVIDGKTEKEIYYHLQNPEYDVLLIFDRLFMGLILKYKMKMLRSLNPSMKIIFADTGFCVPEFGRRLWEVKADGFICNIENEEVFKKAITKILSGEKYFPEIINDEITSGVIFNNHRSSLELTDSEFSVGLYLGKGYSLKEISFATNIPYGSVKTNSSIVKKKLGCKNNNDLMILNQRQVAFDVRSWNC